MNIREVRLSDYEDVEAMMQCVHMLHVQNRPDVFVAQTPVYKKTEFETMVQDDNCLLVLAEDATGVLGLCEVTIKQKSGEIEKKTAYMEVLYVNALSRGKGIGKQLVSYVSTEAKKKGATRLDLMVWSFNESAIKFYEGLGMSPRSYILEKNLN